MTFPSPCGVYVSFRHPSTYYRKLGRVSVPLRGLCFFSSICIGIVGQYHVFPSPCGVYVSFPTNRKRTLGHGYLKFPSPCGVYVSFPTYITYVYKQRGWFPSPCGVYVSFPIRKLILIARLIFSVPLRGLCFFSLYILLCIDFNPCFSVPLRGLCFFSFHHLRL